MKNIAVFASGNGTNFQSLVEAEENRKLKGHIQLLISDKPDAFVIERAKKLKKEVFLFNPRDFNNKSEYETEIAKVLEENKVELIVLAGYMRIVGETLLHKFQNKIINLHPSLLPSFPGKDAIKQAYEYGVKITGATVHFVDEGMDTGPIILQRLLPIQERESLAELTERIHGVEHELLHEAVNLVITNKIEMNGRKVIIKD